MDPATAAVIIRAAGEAGALLIGLLRHAGKAEDAEAIAAILQRSDDTWARILARARAAEGER